MRSNGTALPLSALLLTLGLMLTACESKSTPSPPLVLSTPTLTPLPQSVSSIEPPPSGFYSAKLTASRAKWRLRLSDTPPKSEP